MNIKDKTNQLLHSIDEKTAIAMTIAQERTEAWLTTYNRLVGLALLIGIIVAISLQLWLVVLILFCTLHLQVVFRFSFRTTHGIDLWTNKPKTEIVQQNNTEPGSQPPPISAPSQ